MRSFLLLLSVLCLTPATALADSALFGASPYNVFVLNNFTESGSDVQGALAGNVVNISGYSVGINLIQSQLASQFGAGQFTLVGGTDLIATSGSLSWGNAYEGGHATDLTPNQFSLNHGTETTGGGSPIDFSAQGAKLKGLAATLAAQATSAGDTCTYDTFSKTTCKAVLPGLNIINVSDPGILNGKEIVINSIFAGATVILNVAGTNDTFGGSGFSAFNSGTTVLFNYYQATGLQLGSSGFTASLLAPYAAVNAPSGNFNGNFIASSFSGGIQFNSTDMFTGSLAGLPSPTPEPATMLLIGTALIALSRCAAKYKRRG